jgi:hypothetical protein
MNDETLKPINLYLQIENCNTYKELFSCLDGLSSKLRKFKIELKESRSIRNNVDKYLERYDQVNYASVLEELEIVLPTTRTFSNFLYTILPNLCPNIKSLTLENYQSDSLDFMTNLKQIQSLTLKFTDNQTDIK